MHIAHLTTEFAPIAKVGGLGDVVAALSKSLVEEGTTVEVILPFYSHIDRTQLKNLKVVIDPLVSYEKMEERENKVWSATYNQTPLILIEPKNNFFERGAIYGEEDDLIRFAYFTRTAMEYLLKREKSIDVLNLHDWLTALAAPLYHEVYKLEGLEIQKIVTTIHNMQYQGVCSPEKLSELGLHMNHLVKYNKLQDHAEPNKLNLLKGGLVYSDFLTTVSPTYAKEIQGKEGFGLEHLLVENKDKLQGILNGIDTTYWNPKTDRFLAQNYGPKEAAQKKLENRKALYAKLKMKESKGMLFTAISRLVEQKGPEMLLFAIEYILEKGGEFVLLGSAPEPALKEKFEALAKKYQDHPHAYFHFHFDEPLAHLTYAAADCILVPSLFEPCGLTQIIGLRYGTIPIVHKVGGLNDTIFDIDDEQIPLEKRNGYTFDTPSNEAFQVAIDRAFEHHANDPKKWLLMQENGFKKDWSWKGPTEEYLKIYAR